MDKIQSLVSHCRYSWPKPCFNSTLSVAVVLGLKNTLGRTVRELLSDVEEFWIETFGKVALTGEPIRFTDYSKALDRWYNVYAFCIGDPHEYRVAVLFTDVTQSKRDEATREQLLEAERQARQHLSSLSGRMGQLQQITAALSGAMLLADIAQVFSELAIPAVGAAAGTVVQLIDEGTLEIVHTANYPSAVAQDWHQFSVNMSVPLAEAVRTTTPIWITSHEQYLARYGTFTRTPEHNAWSAFPLIVKGRTIGAIGFSFDEAQIFSEDDKQFMIALAAPYAQALDRTLLYEAQQQAQADAERAKQRLTLLAEVSTILATSLDYTTTLKNLEQCLLPDFTDAYFIHIINEQGEVERAAFAATDLDVQQAFVELTHEYPPNLTSEIMQHTLSQGKVIFTPEVTPEINKAAAKDTRHLELLNRIGTKSSMNLPLLVRDKAIGLMSVGMTTSGRRYTQEDVAFGEEIARRIAQSIDNARLYAQAWEAISVRNEFLSVAAHELRTPITSLRGFAQTLLRQLSKRGTVDPEQLKQGLERIDQQSTKLGVLVGQLLDITRLESGRLVLEHQMTDLVALVQGVAAGVQNATQRHTLSIQAPETLWISIDPVRIEQVVVNLIDNAVKYSPNGGLIEVQVCTEGDKACVSVTDYGMGIAPERRARLFERFYQAHGTGYLGGMGLGLHISHQIAELHGGSLTAEFPENASTCMILQLPYPAKP